MSRIAVVAPEYTGDPDEDDRRYVAVFSLLNSEPYTEAEHDFDLPSGAFQVRVKVPDWCVVDVDALTDILTKEAGVPVTVVALNGEDRWAYKPEVLRGI